MQTRFYQDWFEVWEPEPGVHVIQEPHHAENVKSYLIEGSERAVLLDTGMGVGDIRAVVDDLTTLPVTVLNSHAHWDHIGGNWRFEEILIHREEADDLAHPIRPERLRWWFRPEVMTGALPAGTSMEQLEIKPTRATTLLDGGETIDLGGRSLEIVHAPGHSRGGIVAVDRDNKLMFTTDVAYLTRLYAFNPDSDVRDYRDTLACLEPIAAGMRWLFPSHDATPIEPSVIAEMRAAFDSILAGRSPDFVEEDRATHDFGAFGVMVRPDFSPAEADA